MTGLHRTRWMAVAFAFLVLAGCDGGPTPERLKSDLNTVLADTTPPGLLTAQVADIIDFKRTNLGGNQGQRAVRFVVEARLNRDALFSGWDQYNATTLANAFGSLPNQIGGLKPNGNSVGDVLVIPGTAVYSRGPDSATPWMFRGFAASPEPHIQGASTLEDIWTLVRTAGVDRSDWKVIFNNFHWPPSRALALVTRAHGGCAIAAGPPGGDRWKVVEALRRRESADHLVINLPAHDAVETIRLVRDGTATAAIVDSDTAIVAGTGERAFANQGAYKQLQAIASLYPKPTHVFVRGDSPVNSINDLRDKSVLTVTSTWGTTRIAEDILRAHGLTPAKMNLSTVISLEEALQTLLAGTADAVITAAAVPQVAADSLAKIHPVRLLSLDSDAIALLTSGETHYVALGIPARSYPGQITSVATVAVTALLVTDARVPAPEITSLLETIFGTSDYLRLGSNAGHMISRTTAPLGLPLPLHPAAAAFYAAGVPTNTPGAPQ